MLIDLFPELQRVYSFFNKRFFNSELPKHLEFLWDSGEKQPLRYVPNHGVLKLGAGISGLSAREFLDELLHQMVHIFHNVNGLKDCSHQLYHNKHFLNKALSIGLYVSKHSSKGHAITCSQLKDGLVETRYPTKELIATLNKTYKEVGFDEEIFTEIKGRILGDSKRRQGKYLLKYTCKCPSPHNTIRSGRRPTGKSPLDISCNVCGQKFLCEED